MNLDDYEKRYFPFYKVFAETVRFILEHALLATKHLPRPQSIQCRAKDVESLRRRLIETNKMDTQTLELDRRDLAGVRLIFYTNNDVDRFIESHLIRENFCVEEDSTKIHHPTPENKEVKYRAIHFTVRFGEERTNLPEYANFAGLRCEIQIQTILNHAWSETSHDPIYKANMGNGYGQKAMENIFRRFERIMDEYLIPAGFEIQKAQQEYERLLQGKELFDKNIANLLNNAQNNNERYEILTGLKDYAIPNYDDLQSAYEGLKSPLLHTVYSARKTEPVPIKTTFADMEGFKANTIISLVLDIIENLRYLDVLGTLQILIDIYHDESEDKIRQQILHVVKKLSEYNISIYNQVGLLVQLTLVDHLFLMNPAELARIQPIAITICTESIKTEINGTTWNSEGVVFHSGAIPLSEQLIEVREKSIKSLFDAYDRLTDYTQKTEILNALDAATKTPYRGNYSNDLLATTLKDSARIVDFVTQRISETSYELLQHLEHRFLFEYFRAKGLVEDEENQFGCQVEANFLLNQILKFRDAINSNADFVRYKILVGFESVFPNYWYNQESQYEESEKYRTEESNYYIDEINENNEDDWFHLVTRCAQTKLTDGATFEVFGNFITKLAELKPEVANRFIAKATEDLRRFFIYFLNGMALSGREDLYQQTLENELEVAKNLAEIARHLHYSDIHKPDFADRLLKRAIDKADLIAVIECLLFALDNYETEKVSNADTYLCEAFSYLNEHKDTRWIFNAWFLQKATKFYEKLTSERANQILENLINVKKVDFRVERILVKIAERYPEAVWDYFRDRLAKEDSNGEIGERYEPVPFRFCGLEKELSKNPQIAISKALPWFVQDQRLFRFRGGRLISVTFPGCPAQFAATLAEIIKTGGHTEADFALAVLENYQGEPAIYIILKEIVFRFKDDSRKMNVVRICIDNTGVVRGEFGFVDAFRSRKEFLKEWLTDERQEVRIFAEKHIAELELRIASEHRRAESAKEMWNRSQPD
jgi:ppGpp synthetase/RelA/SpoT-type nucleotidyltranferase